MRDEERTAERRVDQAFAERRLDAPAVEDEMATLRHQLYSSISTLRRRRAPLKRFTPAAQRESGANAPYAGFAYGRTPRPTYRAGVPARSPCRICCWRS